MESPTGGIEAGGAAAAGRRYRWIVRALVVVYAVNCFAQVAADPDLWGHLRFGAEIWETGGIPRTDGHSYTAWGERWINHEWLTEALFWAVYALAGSAGLVVLKVGLGLLVLELLSSLYFARERSLLAYGPCFVLFVLAAAPGFMTRPQLMTYLGLALWLVALDRFFAGRRGAIWWTPLIMLLWVNLHGGVLAGIGLFAVVAALETGRCWLGGERHWLPLVVCFALSCLALLANPYGADLWRFLHQSVSTPRDIDEWAPIVLLNTSHWPFKLMTLLFLATLARPTPKRPWELAIISLTIVYGFRHQRHSVLAAIVMTPYLACESAAAIRGLKGVQRRLRAFSPAFHRALGACLLGFVLFQVGRAAVTHWTHRFSISVDTARYPVAAMRFMEANGIDGNILVPFEWGEYVVWKRPRSRVSLDGRFDTVYPEEVIRAGFAFTAGREGWNRVIEDFPTDIVLSRRTDHGHWLMGTYPGWERIYQDAVAAIWVPVTDPPSPLLRRARAGTLLPSRGSPSSVFP
jgi:hypothetical protein